MEKVSCDDGFPSWGIPRLLRNTPTAGVGQSRAGQAPSSHLLIFSSSHLSSSFFSPSFRSTIFFFFLLLSLRFFFPLTNTLFSLRLISFVLRLPPTRSFFNPRKALLHALAQPCTNCASIPTPSNTTWSACLLV